jgi:hypothetical protein
MIWEEPEARLTTDGQIYIPDGEEEPEFDYETKIPG